LIRKVVVPAAGLGTRLFPATKEQPKEMLPVFSRLKNGHVGVKPLPVDDPKRRCPDIGKAEKVLEWKPKISLQQGLARTIKWFQRKNA
jgi:nucleoside-diphosphate-sugar epimerase